MKNNFSDCQKTFGFEKFLFFSRDEFNFINKHLNKGLEVKVLDPFISHPNISSLAVKTQKLDKFGNTNF